MRRAYDAPLTPLRTDFTDRDIADLYSFLREYHGLGTTRDSAFSDSTLTLSKVTLSQLWCAQAVVLPLPAVEGRLRDAELATQLGNSDATFNPA